jgi:hypothetical protein
MRDRRGAYRVLVGKSEGKRQLGRPRFRSEDNIKMDILEMALGFSWNGLILLTTGTSGGLL